MEIHSTDLNLPQIVDANINRVGEGLRVIEEYLRFVKQDKDLTVSFSSLRKRLSQVDLPRASQLHSRHTETDVRAKEPPRTRDSLLDLLTANFKRVEEGLRVLEEYTGLAVFNESRYDIYDLESTVLLPLMAPSISNGIYLVSDRVDVLEKGLEWGVSLIQLRDKGVGKSELLSRGRIIAPMARAKGIPFIVNDYLDIAQLLDADGLHTGQDDIPVSEQRRLLGPHKLIGRTTHTLEQGLRAQEEGADYVSVGPIWDTPSKLNRSGIGFDYLSQASEKLSIPFVAIGGINLERFSEVLPYSPPLIGLIRDFESIPEMQNMMISLSN